MIDFEASSLDHDSYPIEAGIALWSAPGQPVRGWSALIRPHGEWSRLGHWSPASAKIHGINGADLHAQGLPPAQLAATLNQILAPAGIAWCDGGPYDAHWCGALFKAARAAPAFVLGDWGRLAARLGAGPHARARAFLDQAPPRHRARPDAEQLLLALAHAAGAEPGPVQDLDPTLPPEPASPERPARHVHF